MGSIPVYDAMRALARGISRFPFKEEIEGSNPSALTKLREITIDGDGLDS